MNTKKCNRIQMNTNTEYEYPMSDGIQIKHQIISTWISDTHTKYCYPILFSPKVIGERGGKRLVCE